jgi:superfamily II DNA/RNA helicase
VHVVVGTPGRLIDHLNRGNLDLSHVRVLVLDEADEMLDMGFLPDVERLIEATPSDDRHTMLFSATMPTAIVKMARRYLTHPTFTRADAEEHETAPNVAQHFFSVHRMDKPRLLARILQSPNRGGVYVFVRTKHMADRLVNELEELRIPAIPIHGDLRQTAREKNLDRFREGKATVLVATEVAARGLDVTGVTHVVNYDCPEDHKMYLHRIGRTARAGEAGVAVTFAEFNEVDRLNVIRKAVGADDAEIVPVFSTSELLTERFDLPEEKPWDHLSRAKKGGGGDRSDRGRSADDGGRARRGGGPKPRSGADDQPTDRGDGRDRDRGGRKGRSDGKPKSSRRSEGAGGGRDATRQRSSDRAAAETSERGGDGAAEKGRRGRSDAGSRGTGPAEEATRTRTRTRTRARAGSTPDREGAPADDGAISEAKEDRAEARSRGAGTEPRTRARAGRDRRGGEPGRDRDGDGRRERAEDTDEGSKPRGKQARDRDEGRGSGQRGQDAKDAKGAKGGGRDRTSRSRGGRSGERTGGGRNGGGRDGGGRSGGGRDRASRSGGDRDADATVRTEPRGKPARGEGEPQLARRVKVEHLP